MKNVGVSILVAAASARAFMTPAPVRRPSFVARSGALPAAATNYFDHALIFDCDGVIIETEELHRLAYNAAFQAADLTIGEEPVDWSVEYCTFISTVGGS